MYQVYARDCPRSHPHAFLDGKACCRHPFEGYRARDVLCQGGNLGYRSNCCYRDEEVRCQFKYCRDFTRELLLFFKPQREKLFFTEKEQDKVKVNQYSRSGEYLLP